MSEIKVGDMVTFRTRPNALALTGCKVVGLPAAYEGEPVALIDVGRFAPGDGAAQAFVP